jgi:hydrogenase nickel incorporation protein HypB
MCATCGCSTDHEHDAHPHGHEHGHEHEATHDHEPGPARMIELERRVLAKNDRLAAANRAHFHGRQILALNLVSSPGSGKTTLLERTIRERGAELGASVIEGDQATGYDAERIRAAGARAVQINTGAVCHLDAAMVDRGARELDPAPGSLLFIENVGNLVCPAMFDLGEDARVVLASVTEGDDKPAKYPHMFLRSDLLLVSKIDLLPHVGEFDVDRLVSSARRINPRIQVIHLSARTGEGMDRWYGWLAARRAELAAISGREESAHGH